MLDILTKKELVSTRALAAEQKNNQKGSSNKKTSES
jgi:hypothetical protein